MQLLVFTSYLQGFNTLYVVGSRYSRNFFKARILCFNTLYVVGSRNKKRGNQSASRCFNTLYVVGSKRVWFNHHPYSIVSIHYMLLVQSILDVSLQGDELFQYIICCWFKLALLIASSFFSVSIHYMLLVQFSCIPLSNSICPLFQYIICCWFNDKFFNKKGMSILFQYIICCWFNSNWYWFNFSFLVSIHYMLLVQRNILGLLFYSGSFNTLYVVGSKKI